MRRRALWLLALALALVVGGCSTGAPADLGPGAAAELRDAVHDVAEAAAQGRYDAATVALDEVRAALDAAVEADDVSVRRYREIDRAIQRTEQELARLRAADADAQEEDEPPAAEPAESVESDGGTADEAVTDPSSSTGGAEAEQPSRHGPPAGPETGTAPGKGAGKGKGHGHGKGGPGRGGPGKG